MRARGFSLLEVMVALAILALSLTVLLQAQAQSLSNAGRARDLSVAAMLARAKMVDIEQKLFHEGFTANGEAAQGDFREEGFPEVAWAYKVAEVEMDLSSLASLCGGAKSRLSRLGVAGHEGGEGASAECEAMLAAVGAGASGFMEEMAQGMRLVDVKLTWPDGAREGSLSVHALITQDDFTTQAASDSQRLLEGVNAGGGLGGSGAPSPGGAP